MKTGLVPAIAGLLMLGACATATPYAPVGQADSGGFAEQKIESDRYVVSFSGNSLTERKTVETYLLYRAAELTSQEGFDWFQTVQRATDEDTRFLPSAIGSPYYSGFLCNYRYFGPRGRLWGRGFYRDPFYDPFFDGFGSPSYREITRYEASAEIILGRGPKPAGAEYFDAEDVLINLAGAIQRPQAR
jgi:hypothetical protein